jgi:hypothetical protein
MVAIFKKTRTKKLFCFVILLVLCEFFLQSCKKCAAMSKKRFLFVIISAWVFASGERVEKSSCGISLSTKNGKLDNTFLLELFIIFKAGPK